MSPLRDRKDAKWLLGRRAERAAARYLWRRGYRIIHENYETPHGEIDLVAERRGVLVFIEVKASSLPGGDGALARDPAERVDVGKRSRMRAAARLYLANYEPLSFAHRFDVVTVAIASRGRCFVLEHREAALDPLPFDDGTLPGSASIDETVGEIGDEALPW